MRKPDPTQIYLADAEATRLDCAAMPGAVVLQLRGANSGRGMFIELSVSEALKHWEQVGQLIRKAGALERQASYADASLKF